VNTEQLLTETVNSYALQNVWYIYSQWTYMQFRCTDTSSENCNAKLWVPYVKHSSLL